MHVYSKASKTFNGSTPKNTHIDCNWQGLFKSSVGLIRASEVQCYWWEQTSVIFPICQLGNRGNDSFNHGRFISPIFPLKKRIWSLWKELFYSYYLGKISAIGAISILQKAGKWNLKPTFFPRSVRTRRATQIQLYCPQSPWEEKSCINQVMRSPQAQKAWGIDSH